MRGTALGLLGSMLLGAGLSSATTSAQAGGYRYDAYDVPETVVTRRTVVERRVVAPPRRFVREVIVEQPVVRPRRIVREVVVERAPVYRPRPLVREVVVERHGFHGPRRFGPRSVGYGSAFDFYD